jgi:hypothetical protein
MYNAIEDKPEWDVRKHYFEQDRETLIFYLKELRKIHKGVTIGGVYITGWLYFHLNHYTIVVNKFDENGNSRKIKTTPPLRDNEWLFSEYLHEARVQKAGMCVVGTRRYSKSTNGSSNTVHSILTKMDSRSSISFGASKDLTDYGNMMKLGFSEIHPAFRLPILRNQSFESGEVVFGVKNKAGQDIIYSTLTATLFDENKKGDSEKSAGGESTSFTIDEGGKQKFLSFLEAALPSMQHQDGLLTTPIITATGGDEKMSEDLEALYNNPKKWKFAEMNWDLLNSKVPEQHRTWVEKSCGFFIPGQMGNLQGNRKINTNLADYLKIDDKELRRISILVTDWENNKQAVLAYVESAGNDIDLIKKRRAYYCLDPEDPFSSTQVNIFPAQDAKKKLSQLKDLGLTGKKVYLKIQGGKVTYDLADSNAVVPEFPYKYKTTLNAPCVIFEDAPEIFANIGDEFVAGIDCYKTESSTTDSVGVCVIFKRSGGLSPTNGTIVAIYADRPERMSTFYDNCLKLVQMYNAEALVEAIDHEGLIEHFSRNNCVHYLTKTIKIAQFIKSNSQTVQKVGLPPTTANKGYRMGCLKEYFYQTIDMEGENGEIITDILGVNRVPDIYTLMEIINWHPKGNFDRLVALSHALVLDTYKIDKSIPLLTGEQYVALRENRKTVYKPSSVNGFKRVFVPKNR